MNMTIIMPFRPLGKGSLTTPNGEWRQLADGRWQNPAGEIQAPQRDDIERSIHFLRKNSRFQHKILVAIDNEIYPHPSFLAHCEGVEIIKSSYVPPLKSPDGQDPWSWIPYTRLACAYRDAIATVPDDEWIFYGFTADLIAAKDWDFHIDQARQLYGDHHVYAAMFVEMKAKAGTNLDYEILGTTPTPHQIWIEFREKVCCHGLTWPIPAKGYSTEEDFNEYITIARRGQRELGVPKVIFERCGERAIGYYNCLAMQARYAKIAGFSMKGMGFDIEFDDNLRDKAGRMKGVVTDSYIYHPQIGDTVAAPFRWRDV